MQYHSHKSPPPREPAGQLVNLRKSLQDFAGKITLAGVDEPKLCRLLAVSPHVVHAIRWGRRRFRPAHALLLLAAFDRALAAWEAERRRVNAWIDARIAAMRQARYELEAYSRTDGIKYPTRRKKHESPADKPARKQ